MRRSSAARLGSRVQAVWLGPSPRWPDESRGWEPGSVRLAWLLSYSAAIPAPRSLPKPDVRRQWLSAPDVCSAARSPWSPSAQSPSGPLASLLRASSSTETAPSPASTGGSTFCLSVQAAPGARPCSGQRGSGLCLQCLLRVVMGLGRGRVMGSWEKNSFKPSPDTQILCAPGLPLSSSQNIPHVGCLAPPRCSVGWEGPGPLLFKCSKQKSKQIPQLSHRAPHFLRASAGTDQTLGHREKAGLPSAQHLLILALLLT